MDGQVTVVGVDGSRESRAALRWALADAAAHGHAIQAVMCVETGETHRHPLSAASRRAMAAEATHVLDLLVAEEVAGQASPPDIDVHVDLTHRRSVADTLLAEAAGAALLVVGSHGAGRTQLLLGSVSRQCAERTRIPLVIVPEGASR